MDLYKLAQQKFSENDLITAENILLNIIKSNKNDYDAYNFLGIINLHNKNYKKAINYFEKIIHLFNNLYEVHYNLALSYQNEKRYEDAINHYQKVLHIKNDHLDALINIALCYKQVDNENQAIKIFNRCLSIDPQNSKVYNDLGNLYLKKEELEESLKYYNKAIELEPLNYEYIYNKGNVFYQLGEYELAKNNYLKALEIKPDYVLALNNLGVIYIKLNEFDKADNYFSKILEYDNQNLEAIIKKGENLAKSNQYDRAVEVLKEALEIDPKNEVVYMLLGDISAKLENYSEAEEYYEKAKSGTRNKSYVYTNLGTAKLSSGHIDEALDYFNRALRDRQDIPELNYNIAHISLLLGNYEEGWEKYEWRKKRDDFFKRDLPIEKELVDQDVKGKILFIYDEQGLGDSIQFIRYLPKLKKLGCTIIFECDSLLYDLYSKLPYIDVLKPHTQEKNIDFDYDYHLSLLSLPHFFHTKKDTIPSEVPYLKQNPEYLSKWENKFAKDKFNIGIVWAGNPKHSNDQNRSLSLKLFKNISKLPGVQLYSLQKGAALSQIYYCGFDIINLEEEGLKTFEDTAAIMKNLDLVISIDSSPVHLAGALNVPVWIMLPYMPDWRWQLDRKDSEWYPSAKLFRQNSFNNWSNVFKEIENELKQILAEKKNLDVTVSVRQEQAELNSAENFANKNLIKNKLILELYPEKFTGWGVCSKYLIKELGKRINTIEAQSIPGIKFEEFPENNIFQGIAFNNTFKPILKNKCKQNIGYCFFENEVNKEIIKNASLYDLIFCGSTWCYEKLIEKNIVNIDLLIQGVDTELFYPEEIKKNPNLFIIFSGGKFEFRKGQDLVLKAIDILQKKYKDIILINSWSNKYASSVETMNYSKYIKIPKVLENWENFINNVYKMNDIEASKIFTLPLLENNKMREIYLKADLGLFPNRCEGGTNLVLMELMACGIPVIASYNSGHKDILNENNSLLLKEMNEIRIHDEKAELDVNWYEPSLDEIITKVEYAYLNRSDIKKIGKVGAEYIKEFTWGKAASKIISKLEV